MNADSFSPYGCTWTSKGWMHDSLLTKTVGTFENENEATSWQEWRDSTGEIVKRSAQIRLKKWPEDMDSVVKQAILSSSA
jgi:hypothetical protein